MTDRTELIEICKIAQHKGGPQNLSAVGIGRYLRLCSPEVVMALLAENENLKGLQPDFPPRPPDGDGLPRFGLRWNGPQQPLAVPMIDGYWTPWHLADQIKTETAALRKALTECTASLEGEMLQKYHGQKPEDMHPVNRRDYDWDMAEIDGFKALIKETQ